jgi:diaminopimelate epimerase
MGLPRFSPAEIPMLVFGERVVDYPLEVDGETIPLTALSTGTTHTVVLMDELPADERFFRISPLIEEHPLFPERTSVMWTARDPDPGASRLRLRIWERGAGETLGCGSGACAAALAARLRGWVGDEVLVGSRGGELLVHWRPGEEIALTGPAEYVFEGRLAVNG